MRSYAPVTSGSSQRVFFISAEKSSSVRFPSISSRVSLSISRPALMMNTAMTAPTQASRLIPQAMKTIAESSTDAESIASKVASEPEAMREPELTSSPFFLT